MIRLGCSGSDYGCWRDTGWGDAVDVYAYFDNDWEVFAPRNALALRRMLAAEAGVVVGASAERAASAT